MLKQNIKKQKISINNGATITNLKNNIRILSSGFTIVELLVVIVIIGILAAITIVSYNGITQSAVVASLSSDLTNSSNQLKIYQTTNGSYPTALNSNNCPNTPVVDMANCLKLSPGNTLTYSSNGINFTLTETSKNNTKYKITNNTAPTVMNVITSCLDNFIIVPGSDTYGTSDFCVMKYEAKNDGSNNAVSAAAGLPWVNISQTSAITKSADACTGCHLITEAEWMTIAQNVLSVPSNWSTGIFGSGYIYSGHNDSSPNGSLAASTDDDNYYGTGNTAGDTTTINGIVGATQRRTLTLTNGQVIWDMSGNVREWTSDTATNNQPGVSGGGYVWREWPNITTPGSLEVNSSPVSTGLPGSNTWNNGKGIGQVFSSTEETALRGFLRSGAWSSGHGAGILMLALNNVPSFTYNNVGFRVSQ